MQGVAGAVRDFDSFVMVGGMALRGMAVACHGETAVMFVDRGVIEVEFVEASYFIDDVVEERELERA